jgi:hypothetical protein
LARGLLPAQSIGEVAQTGMARRLNFLRRGGHVTGRMLAVIVALLVLPRLGAGQDRTALDYGLAVGSTALIVADWSQTLQLADNPHRWGELNPILGRHPSKGRVNTLLSLAVISNGGALLLPKTPRRIWYAAVTVLEAIAVIHNLSVGASIGF